MRGGRGTEGRWWRERTYQREDRLGKSFIKSLSDQFELLVWAEVLPRYCCSFHQAFIPLLAAFESCNTIENMYMHSYLQFNFNHYTYIYHLCTWKWSSKPIVSCTLRDRWLMAILSNQLSLYSVFKVVNRSKFSVGLVITATIREEYLCLCMLCWLIRGKVGLVTCWTSLASMFTNIKVCFQNPEIWYRLSWFSSAEI